MRTPEQVKWDFVQQWLEKASKDLEAARVLLDSGVEAFDAVAFHAQQAAEKFFKTVAVRLQIAFPKTHDIARLRKLLAQRDPGLADRVAFADALTPYAVEFRYPGDLGPVSQEQAQEALRLAEQAREEVLRALKAYLDGGRPAREAAAPSE